MEEKETNLKRYQGDRNLLAIVGMNNCLKKKNLIISISLLIY